MVMEDIIVNIRSDSRQALNQIKAVGKELANLRKQALRSSQELSTLVRGQFAGMRSASKALFATGEIPDINRDLKLLGQKTMPQVVNGFGMMNDAVAKTSANLDKKLTKEYSRVYDQVLGTDNLLQKSSKNGGFKSVDDILNNVNTQLKDTRIHFQGWALSIMFFGMALQRTFTQIWKQSSKTFQDVMHSVEGTTTGFDMLSGSVEYLKFSVGEALEPLAASLIPLVDKITDWVQQNPELVRGIVAVGIALGTILTVAGTLVLAFGGFREALLLAFGVDIQKLLATHGGLLGGLKALYAGLKAEVIATSTAFKAMGLASKIGLLGMIGGIIAALVWIYKLQESMGGWGEFFKSVIRGVLRVFVLLGDGIAFVGSKIVQSFVSMLNGVINGINWLITQSNKMLGTNVGRLGTLSSNNQYQFGDLFSKYADWEANSRLSPSKGYAEFGGLTPEYRNSNQTTLVIDDAAMQKLLEGQSAQINQMVNANVPS